MEKPLRPDEKFVNRDDQNHDEKKKYEEGAEELWGKQMRFKSYLEKSPETPSGKKGEDERLRKRSKYNPTSPAPFLLLFVPYL